VRVRATWGRPAANEATAANYARRGVSFPDYARRHDANVHRMAKVRARITRAMMVFAAFALLVAAPAASSAAYTIRVGAGGVISNVGPWSMSNPSLMSAQQSFGAPSIKRPKRPGFAGGPVADCEAVWSSIGLSVVFSTLSIEPGSCNPAKVIWTARITSRKWQTWHGLRVGDPSSRVLRDHPWASLHGGLWWLASTAVPWGSQPYRIATVIATVRNGRVSGFDLWVQAQGE
jgi:hypothetical protein